MNKNEETAMRPLFFVRLLVPAARLELAHLAAADFESATSTDSVTRA
jgi:hypothetical protein